MAQYKVSDFEIHAVQERRKSDRHVTVFKPIMFSVNDFPGMLLVRNISAGGLMGHVYTRLPVGARMLVELHPGLSVDAQIVWANDVDVGVEFDEPIDPESVLEAMLSHEYDGLLHRAPRLPVGCPARLRADRFLDHVTAIDVSQGGAKISTDLFKVGEDVDLTISGLEPRRARIVWTRHGHSGLQFFRTIDCIALAKWANAMKPLPQAA